MSLAGAASAALASHSAMSDAAKASLAALVAKSGEALRTVSRDNELVYYAKVPPSDSLPAIEAKVLAKPTPVAPLVEAVGALPPPPTIVKPEEAVIGGGGEDGDGFGEALGRLFSRLGSEFKMIPLSDRRANEREEEEAMRRARQVAKEAEKREAAEKGGALSALGALFGGGGGGSAKSGSGGKSEEGSRGKQEKKKEESKDGSSSSSSAKKRQGKDDGGDGDDGATEEDRALQAALAASLKEVSVSKSSSAPASNATANAASGSLRPPSARPDLLSRALSASSGGGGGGSFAPSAMEYPSFDSRRAPPPPPPPPPAPMGYGASYGSGPLVDLSDTHPPPPPPAFPAYNSALGGGGCRRLRRLMRRLRCRARRRWRAAGAADADGLHAQRCARRAQGVLARRNSRCGSAALLEEWCSVCEKSPIGGRGPPRSNRRSVPENGSDHDLTPPAWLLYLRPRPRPIRDSGVVEVVAGRVAANYQRSGRAGT